MVRWTVGKNNSEPLQAPEKAQNGGFSPRSEVVLCQGQVGQEERPQVRTRAGPRGKLSSGVRADQPGPSSQPLPTHLAA